VTTIDDSRQEREIWIVLSVPAATPAIAAAAAAQARA
jgi:hypothetical protein